MSNKPLINVPDGMYYAATKAFEPLSSISDALEAALRWLSENPIVPTSEQLYSTIGTLPVAMCDIVWTERDRAMIAEWQRRMFVDPEPEVPEEIKDLIIEDAGNGATCRAEKSNERVIEAFRRGQRSTSTADGR